MGNVPSDGSDEGMDPEPKGQEDPKTLAEGYQKLHASIAKLLSDEALFAQECRKLMAPKKGEDCGVMGEGERRVPPAELQAVTQHLIDRLGCRHPSTLQRVTAIFTGFARRKEGLTFLEFQGYVASVLTQIQRELESRCAAVGLRVEMPMYASEPAQAASRPAAFPVPAAPPAARVAAVPSTEPKMPVAAEEPLSEIQRLMKDLSGFQATLSQKAESIGELEPAFGPAPSAYDPASNGAQHSPARVEHSFPAWASPKEDAESSGLAELRALQSDLQGLSASLAAKTACLEVPSQAAVPKTESVFPEGARAAVAPQAAAAAAIAYAPRPQDYAAAYAQPWPPAMAHAPQQPMVDARGPLMARDVLAVPEGAVVDGGNAYVKSFHGGSSPSSSRPAMRAAPVQQEAPMAHAQMPPVMATPPPAVEPQWGRMPPFDRPMEGPPLQPQSWPGGGFEGMPGHPSPEYRGGTGSPVSAHSLGEQHERSASGFVQQQLAGGLKAFADTLDGIFLPEPDDEEPQWSPQGGLGMGQQQQWQAPLPAAPARREATPEEVQGLLQQEGMSVLVGFTPRMICLDSYGRQLYVLEADSSIPPMFLGLPGYSLDELQRVVVGHLQHPSGQPRVSLEFQEGFIPLTLPDTTVLRGLVSVLAGGRQDLPVLMQP